jgi:hypothetical protein
VELVRLELQLLEHAEAFDGGGRGAGVGGGRCSLLFERGGGGLFDIVLTVGRGGGGVRTGAGAAGARGGNHLGVPTQKASNEVNEDLDAKGYRCG